MNKNIENNDLRVFATVVRKASFVAAAEELGMSPAYVSKRIGMLEEALGVRLFHRTTRRVVVSDDGEQVYTRALTILASLDSLFDEVAERQGVPRGQLRVSSSFGFGRNVVAPAIARLAAGHPALQVRLEVFDRLVDIVSEGFDIDVRIGDEIAPQLIARRLMTNHRILCASPAYLARRGTPATLRELEAHDCLPIKERDLPFGVWRLRSAGEEGVVKVTGPLSTNHGEIALQWAVAGAGIVLRSRWDAQAYLDRGQLVQILPAYTQEANVWAVYPQRLASSAKVRVFVDFLERHLACDNPGSTNQTPRE
ncbi:LysR substrate-binding domain-containing protein [Duganella sp. CF517]|uniref:LysR substrate-binding domain-containing protein n=1 Tax=Duganella sp. CF517 TaxID=1881038 RepID=UPI0035A39A06